MKLKKYLAKLSLLCLLASAFVLLNGEDPAFATDAQCVTNTYSSADEAKANYGNDCGRPFESRVEFRCDWVPGGWQCSGPGASTSTPSIPSQLPQSEPVAPVADTSTSTDCSDGVGGIYNTADEAKANYRNDCGRPFESRVEFRCDWVPGGWQCSGPASNSAPTPSAPATPPVPSVPQEPTQPVQVSQDLQPVEILGIYWEGAEEDRIRIAVRDNVNRDRDGYNIYRNGDYWTTSNSSRGALTNINDPSPGDTVVYQIQAFRHTEDGTEWGPKEAVVIPFEVSLRNSPKPNHVGNGGVTNQSAAEANEMAQAAQEAQEDSEQALDEFRWSFVPTEVALSGINPREIAQNYFEWRELDARAERYVRGAQTLSNLHRQCVASPSSCYLNPDDNGNGDSDSPAPQVGGNEGATRPGADGDGTRGEGDDEPQTGGNEGQSRPGDGGDGLRG